MTQGTEKKLKKLALKIEDETRQRFIKKGFNLESQKFNVTVKPGRKYIKVDVGSSGTYMVNKKEEIFGIKAYGVIHLGHKYGTLDTIDEYFWGGYKAVKVNL